MCPTDAHGQPVDSPVVENLDVTRDAEQRLVGRAPRQHRAVRRDVGRGDPLEC